GAVPLYAANWSRPGKRDTSATSPITVPAMTGPTPKISVRVVPLARPAVASFFFVPRIWVPGWRRSARNSAASSQRAVSTAPDGVIGLQDTGHRNCGDLPGDAAGDQIAEHGAEPAGDLIPGAPRVTVAPGPDLQHRRVIISGDRPRAPGAQRRDRDRPGVVRVVLVTRPGRQQPHPRAQLRLHIEHPLAGGSELPGQQVPRPARALHRPRPLRPASRPRYEPLSPGRRRAHPHLAQRLL